MFDCLKTLYGALPIFRICTVLLWLGAMNTTAHAQRAFFVDGFHGGVYGHYPVGYTQYMLGLLEEHPYWKLNLEIEPATWDWVRQTDATGYKRFGALLKDAREAKRIEFVNPTFAQPYMFNIAGESIIRQFHYGMAVLKRHFPNVDFQTYSSEEPCFTSALPQLLRSFGFRYASLKNPNTGWGGYVRAYGKDLVDWTGPDGSKIPTVPRYAIEELATASTWETIANSNSKRFVRAAFDAGVRYPLGMCLQDAGWKNGPWLGDLKGGYQPTEYTRWRDYFELLDRNNVVPESWKVTQEDIQVSLVWGSQVLQRLAQQTRNAENLLLQTEKSRVLDWFYLSKEWPEARFTEAWENVMLAQHHDCWIVPYNNLNGETWFENVKHWTDKAIATSADLLESGVEASDRTRLTVRNVLPYDRNGIFLSKSIFTAADTNRVVWDNNAALPTQWIAQADGKTYRLAALVHIPAMAQRNYRLLPRFYTGAVSMADLQKDGSTYIIQTDRHRIVIDTLQGGMMTSLKSQADGWVEWVAPTEGALGFNQLRGFFPEENRFIASSDQPAHIEIVENGPLRCQFRINTQLGSTPVIQDLLLSKGQDRIDMETTIDWKANSTIGKFVETDYQHAAKVKAFYDDRFKLLLLFPAAIAKQKIYKNAPFDVMESTLESTYFDSWDSIKNNIILDWVDLAEENNKRGLALFVDHTTSYVHGPDHPLGLTIQYAGKGLWGMDYGMDGPTRVSYSILPHRHRWDVAQIWRESDDMKSPLIQLETGEQETIPSLFAFDQQGFHLSASYVEKNALILRVFNAEAASDERLKIRFVKKPEAVWQEELDGRKMTSMAIKEEKGKGYYGELDIPRFGVRTLRVTFR